MNVKRWDPRKKLEDIHMDTIEFSVQIYGLALEHIDDKNVVTLGEQIGGVISIDKNMMEGKWRKNYVRVRVALPVDEPLSSRAWVLG